MGTNSNSVSAAVTPTSSPWPRAGGHFLPRLPRLPAQGVFGLRGLSDLDWLINGLDGSQLVRLQKCRLLIWGHRCKEKHPAASVPTRPPPSQHPPPTLESQTLGKLTLGRRRGEGGVKANRLPSHLRSSSSSFSSFDFVCARCRFPGRSFSAPRQIPTVLTDSPDLITVNEAAKTFRSKWKTWASEGSVRAFFIFLISGGERGFMSSAAKLRENRPGTSGGASQTLLECNYTQLLQCSTHIQVQVLKCFLFMVFSTFTQRNILTACGDFRMLSSSF